MRQVVLDVSEYQTPQQLNEILTQKEEDIVGVYIKLTQSIDYINDLANIYAGICKKHGIPVGYYDFLTNNQQMIDEKKWFNLALTKLRLNMDLIPMLDCEGDVVKEGDVAASHWIGGQSDPVIVYASESVMSNYEHEKYKWIADYIRASDELSSDIEVNDSISFRNDGYTLWQFTDHYMGYNQDASILLIDSINELRIKH